MWAAKDSNLEPAEIQTVFLSIYNNIVVEYIHFRPKQNHKLTRANCGSKATIFCSSVGKNSLGGITIFV